MKLLSHWVTKLPYLWKYIVVCNESVALNLSYLTSRIHIKTPSICKSRGRRWMQDNTMLPLIERKTSESPHCKYLVSLLALRFIDEQSPGVVKSNKIQENSSFNSYSYWQTLRNLSATDVIIVVVEMVVVVVIVVAVVVVVAGGGGV